MIKHLFMLLIMAAMSVNFAGCSDDDDPVKDKEDEETTTSQLAGTRWTYVEQFEEDGIESVQEYSISFTSTTATYSLAITVTEGSQHTTSSVEIDYTYTYSEGLVIFNPTEAGKAYLEGEITSNVRMVVTNVSTGEVIGTFYKQ